MAHQSHNLPWNTLAGHLKYAENANWVTPNRTDLFLLRTSRAANDLNYFKIQFTRTVSTFAETERAKYPAQFPINQTGRLFDSELFDRALPFTRNPDPAHLHNYRIKHMNLRHADHLDSWIEFVGDQPSPPTNHPYNEIVSLLLSENQMVPLLTLTNHPAIHLDRLDFASHNDQSGWTTTVLDALAAYVTFNILYCKPELWTEGCKDHLKAVSVQRSVRRLKKVGGGDLIYLPARKFVGNPWVEEPGDDTGRVAVGVLPEFDPMGDLDALRMFLRDCFDIFVRYHVLEVERTGTPPDWGNMYDLALEGMWR